MLRGANPSRRFEPDSHPGFLRVFANCPRHHEANRQSCIGRFFSGRCLNEIRAGHHRDRAGSTHVAQRHQIASAQNDLHVHGATGLLEPGNLIIEFLPATAENMGSRDDHVDLLRARFHRASNLRHSLGKRRKSRGKTGRNRGHPHRAAFQRPTRRFDKAVVDTDRPHLNIQFLNLQPLQQLVPQRIPALGAQSPHALIRIVARKGRQIHARDCAQQPCHLPFFLDAAPQDMALGTPLNCAGIDAYLLHPFEIQRNPAIGEQGLARERGNRSAHGRMDRF